MTPSGLPTAFLVIPQGLAARMLLRTDILPTLTRAGVRVVVLAPNADEAYFRQEFESEQVSVVALDGTLKSDDLTPLRSALYRMRTWGLAEGHRSPAFRDKYTRAFSVPYRISRPIVARVIDVLIRACWHSRLLRRLVSWIERALVSQQRHEELFARYRPSLLVTTGLGSLDSSAADMLLLREAKRHRVPTAVVILSWDHPTSLGYRAVVPDLVVAWSERMAAQISRFHDIPPDRIKVGGVPHFDRYRRPRALLSWDNLSDELGLDRSRRLIFLPTGSPREHLLSYESARSLAEAVDGDRFGEPAQLVIRIHPNCLKPDQGERLARYGFSLNAYHQLASECPYVHVLVPEVLSQRLRCDLSSADGILLNSLIANAAVVVNIFSTTTLEAFMAGRPAVIVGEDAYREPDAATAADESWRPFASYLHQEMVMQTEAAPVVHSEADMVEQVRKLIEQPEAGANARERVAAAECGPLDGAAGARIGRLLVATMGSSRPRPSLGGQVRPAHQDRPRSPA